MGILRRRCTKNGICSCYCVGNTKNVIYRKTESSRVFLSPSDLWVQDLSYLLGAAQNAFFCHLTDYSLILLTFPEADVFHMYITR